MREGATQSRDWTSPLPEVAGLLRWLSEKRQRTASEAALLRELQTLLEDRAAGQALELERRAQPRPAGADEAGAALAGAAAPMPPAPPAAAIVIKTDDGG